jgi:Sulfotransferase family
MRLRHLQCIWYIFIWVGIAVITRDFCKVSFILERDTEGEGTRKLMQYTNTSRISRTANKADNALLSLLNRTAQPKHYTPYKNRKILFVHVGKAGGETIKQITRVGCQSMRNPQRRNECLQKLPSSHLSNHIYGYYHCYKIYTLPKLNTSPKKNKTTESLFNTYLFSVRHPVERIQSWYNYVHPNYCSTHYNIENNTTKTKSSNKSGLSCEASYQVKRDPTGFVGTFFVSCFPTINAWADAIQQSKRFGIDEAMDQSSLPRYAFKNECFRLARDSIIGKLDRQTASMATHLIANYRHYINHTINQHPQNDIAVVRTNHLWNDLQNLDRIQFKGTGQFGTMAGTAYTHGIDPKLSISNETAIRTNSIQVFCCALLNEMHIYRYLVLNAINLVDADKYQTMEHAIEYCGYKTWDQMINDCTNKV